MWRYTSITDVFQILKANLLSTITLVFCSLSIASFQSLPLEIIFIDFVISILLTSSSRLGVRLIYSHLLNPNPYRFNFRKRVILIGAGKAGEFICRELLNNSKHLMDPIGFLDDKKTLKGNIYTEEKCLEKFRI